MMKLQKLIITFLAVACFSITDAQAATGHRFAYKFKPNQQWIKTDLYETHSEAMGFKNVTRNTTVIKYQVKPANKKGWVRLEGSVASNTTQMDDQPPQDMGVLRIPVFQGHHRALIPTRCATVVARKPTARWFA